MRMVPGLLGEEEEGEEDGEEEEEDIDLLSRREVKPILFIVPVNLTRKEGRKEDKGRSKRGENR